MREKIALSNQLTLPFKFLMKWRCSYDIQYTNEKKTNKNKLFHRSGNSKVCDNIKEEDKR